MKIKSAKDVKKLLAPIPENKWTIGEFTDGKEKCCFIGHYIRLTSDNPKNYSYTKCHDFGNNKRPYNLREKTKEFLRRVHGIYEDGASVNNDAGINGYNEETPKARVMHLLDDMIDHGY